MKSLIYYPNFESTDLNWIKFALLYIGKLNPIIPETGDRHLSRLYDKLQNETDLFEFHRPKYQEGYEATLDAIDIVERIMRDPFRYDLKLGEINAIRIWQLPELQNYKLYEEKFSHDWEHFCFQNGFARRTDGGILMPKQLGNIYMTVLANTIADKRGVSPITDKPKVDELSFFLRRKAPVQIDTISNARSVIHLTLPARLEEINFNEIIALRNSKNFLKYQEAFQNKLEAFYRHIEQGKTAMDFVNKYQNALNDFNEQIFTLTTDTASFALGCTLLLQSQEYTATDFFKTVILAGSALMVKSAYSVRRTWRNTQTDRYCRRYVTKLSNLPYSIRGRSTF